MIRLLKFSAIYFALVFGAGFALGPIRVLWLVPRVGERLAELIEAPIMLAVVVFAARWIVRRLGPDTTPSDGVIVGSVALGLLLSCESGVVLWLRGLNIAEYVASRDPVAGAVYLVLLALFAVMPLVVAHVLRGGSLSSGKAR
jgi:hypothetical protein